MRNKALSLLGKIAEKEFPRVILSSYSEIFFLSNPWIGLAFWLPTLLNPNLFLSGLF